MQPSSNDNDKTLHRASERAFPSSVDPYRLLGQVSSPFRSRGECTMCRAFIGSQSRAPCLDGRMDGPSVLPPSLPSFLPCRQHLAARACLYRTSLSAARAPVGTINAAEAGDVSPRQSVNVEPQAAPVLTSPAGATHPLPPPAYYSNSPCFFARPPSLARSSVAQLTHLLTHAGWLAGCGAVERTAALTHQLPASAFLLPARASQPILVWLHAFASLACSSTALPRLTSGSGRWTRVPQVPALLKLACKQPITRAAQKPAVCSLHLNRSSPAH